MQCPPSPLLFDPSVSLEPSLRDVPEAPIDILALEEPDRGSSSSALLPPAEGPLQVGLEGLAPKSPEMGFSQQETPSSSSPQADKPGGLFSHREFGCARGVGGIGSARVGVAARGGSVGGSVPPWSWGWDVWGTGDVCLLLELLHPSSGGVFRGVVSHPRPGGSPFSFLFTGITENCSSPPAWSLFGVSPRGQVISPTPCPASPVTSPGVRAKFWGGGALTEDPRFAVAVGFKQEPRGKHLPVCWCSQPHGAANSCGSNSNPVSLCCPCRVTSPASPGASSSRRNRPRPARPPTGAWSPGP